MDGRFFYTVCKFYFTIRRKEGWNIFLNKLICTVGGREAIFFHTNASVGGRAVYINLLFFLSGQCVCHICTFSFFLNSFFSHFKGIFVHFFKGFFFTFLRSFLFFQKSALRV